MIRAMDAKLLDQLRDMESILDKIEDESLRAALRFLKNALEHSFAENQELRKENQRLRDENNRLKGEQGKPSIRPQTQDSDISSEKERAAPKIPAKKKSKKTALKPTRTEKRTLDKSKLPTDAVNKGIESNLIQDIIFTPDIIEFQREVYYSPSEKKRFIADLPPGYEGEFGPGLKCLVLTLHHDANVSQPNILKLLLACGISISASSISRILMDHASQFHQEKQDIVAAGFQSTSYQHIDDTGARVNGKNHHVQVLCNPLYTAYFTTQNRDRLTVLRLLFQGEMKYQMSEASFQLMISMGLSLKQLERLKTEPLKHQMSQSEVDTLLLRLFPNPKKQHKSRIVIQEAAAIVAYRQREDAVKILICDDAGQFKNTTEYIGACWVHEGRHYKKLKPIFKKHREALEHFLGLFWALYHALLKYKCDPSHAEAARVSQLFDHMVTPTGYEDLDKRIQRTASRKQELLLVLAYPEIELHNNPAELGARTQARKRDVSLQTINEAGTQAKDTMMTIVQTARKLGVSTYNYLYDRISEANTMLPLSELIRQRSTKVQTFEEKLAA